MRDVSALEKMGTIVRFPHLQLAAQFALGPAEVCTIFIKTRCNAKRIWPTYERRDSFTCR